MDFIIRMILSIFQEIFDQDAKRRQPQAPTARPGADGKRPTPEEVREYYRRLLEGPGAQAPPRKPETSPPPLPQKHKETLQEHIQHVEERNKRMAARSGLLSDSPEGETKKAKTRFKLPGESPLARMIVAGVILGPCRAKNPYRLNERVRS